MGCTSSTAAPDSQAPAHADARAQKQDAESIESGSRNNGEPDASPVARSRDSRTVGQESVRLHLEVRIDVDASSDAGPSSPDSAHATVGTPSGASAGKRKQFKWIATTMWQHGDVCASCGSATPKGCTAGCMPASPLCGSSCAYTPGLAPLCVASPCDSLEAAREGSPLFGSPVCCPTPVAAHGGAHMTGMQPATAAGGAIAQYRLGQAMAAMRLRTDAPAHTLGPAHHRAGRRESYLSSMTIGTASPRRTPRVPPPVSARARAAVFRSESTSSGEWGTFTSDVDTPGSADTAEEDASLANVLSFYTFNALLGYSRGDMSSPDSMRGADSLSVASS